MTIICSYFQSGSGVMPMTQKVPPTKKQVSPLSLGMHQVHSTHGKSTMYWACGSGKTPQIHTYIKPPLKKPEDRAKRMQLNKQLVNLISI